MIGIVYLTFNRLAFTRQTLPALLKYRPTDSYVVLIDNGSSDGTPKYLKDFTREEKNVDLHLLPKNVGLSAATNMAWDLFRLKKLDYIGKVDNDLMINPETYLDTAQFLYENPGIDMIGFPWWVPEECAGANYKVLPAANGKQWIKMRHLGGNYLARARIMDHGEIDPTKKLRTRGLKLGWTEYQGKLVCGYQYPFRHHLLLDNPFLFGAEQAQRERERKHITNYLTGYHLNN